MASLVAATATLTPAVRLAKAISEFGSGLNDKYRPVFKTWQTHSPPSEIDVIQLTEEINRDGERLHQNSWKPFGTRFLKYLDQIQILIKPGDILVSGSQNMIASGVWASVRMSLEIATNYLSYFEKLSLLLMRLGHATAIQRDRVMLFPNDSDLRSLTCEYLIVVVEMCKVITLFEEKGFLAQLAASACLEKDFKEFEIQLSFWSKVINKKLAYLNEASQARANTTIASISKNISSWTESGRRAAEDRRIQVLRQLPAHRDEFETTWRRERRKGSVEWVFNDERYKDWRSASISSSLVIYGSLGSGKTVTMANIIGRLWSSLTTKAKIVGSSQCAVASFLCQSLNKKTLSPRVLFGSMAHQFLKSLKLPASHPAVRQYNNEVAANDADYIIDYTTVHFPKDCHYFVMIDGLDELSVENAHEVLRPLADFQKHRRVHICCSVRFDSSVRFMISDILQDTVLISMSSPHKDKEIQSFVEGELNRRAATMNLDEAIRKHIQDVLVQGAQGMYLWVVLQLNALFPPYGDTLIVLGDFINFLDRLPKGLFESYEEALGNIQDDRYGSRIFELVAAAIRPLTKNELRSALNVEPGVPVWNDSTLPLDVDAMVYRCGGGLLYIDEEDDTVYFIHHSALRHIMQEDDAEDANNIIGGTRNSHRHDTYLFTAHQAESTMGFTCVTTLHLEHQDRRVVTQNKLIVDHRAIQTISNAVTHDSLLARFMKIILQQESFQEQAQVDLNKMIKSLSRARTSITLHEAQLFSSYAESHWPDHTSRPCLNLQREAKFHQLFLQLIIDNAPGLTFPWENDKSDSMTAWAKTDKHFRLLFHLLCQSKGQLCKEIVQVLCQTSKAQLSGFCCHKNSLGDILCRLIDIDPQNVLGVEVLLSLGASPDEPFKSHPDQDVYALELAIERLAEEGSYEVGVMRALLQGGANTTTSRFSGRPPPILLAIEKQWRHGYQALFSYGLRVFAVCSYLPQQSSLQIPGFHYLMSALDLAILCGHDSNEMFEALIRCGAKLETYFRLHCWPINLRKGFRASDTTDASGVNSNIDTQSSEALKYQFLSVQDFKQGDKKVLEWILKSKPSTDFVNTRASNGMTPLGLAINLSDVALVKDLLAAGANPSTMYRSTLEHSHRPLLEAARQGCTEITRILIDQGASIHETVNDKTILAIVVNEELALKRDLDEIQKALEGHPTTLGLIRIKDPSPLSTLALAVIKPFPDRAMLGPASRLLFRDVGTDISQGIKSIISMLEKSDKGE